MPEEKQVLFEPKQMYERMLKSQYHQGALDYFNELLKDSGVDEAKNAQLVNSFEDAKKRLANAHKKLSGAKALKMRGIHILRKACKSTMTAM